MRQDIQQDRPAVHGLAAGEGRVPRAISKWQRTLFLFMTIPDM